MALPGRSVICWFRRDLRLTDNPTLAAAAAEARASGIPLVGLFVVDDGLLATGGPNRRAFLARTLAALDGAVDGSLVLRRGRPERVVPAVAAEFGARTVVATGDCGPYGRRRDRRVADALVADGRDLTLVGSPYAVSPGRVVAGGGAPHRVFTHFRRAWTAHGWPVPIERPSGVQWAGGDRELAAADLDPSGWTATLPKAGEEAGAAALEHFLAGPVGRYAEDRDRPDLAGTSRLSPHLRFGTLHPRQVLAQLGSGSSADVFRSELAWREFYADVLWHRPDSAWRPLSAVGDHLRWDEGPEADGRFAAWTEGRTGFPLVDAGMRQLTGEGWMHNRVRMVTASFLVKDLHLDWRRGRTTSSTCWSTATSPPTTTDGSGWPASAPARPRSTGSSTPPCRRSGSTLTVPTWPAGSPSTADRTTHRPWSTTPPNGSRHWPGGRRPGPHPGRPGREGRIPGGRDATVRRLPARALLPPPL